MTLILSGTDGLSDVDGSAATPALRGTDANTGIFFPAADTIGFAEGGAEVMRIDSSGNVGIGTATPNNRLMVSSPLTGTTPRSNSVVRIQSEAAGRDVNIQFSDNVTYSAEIGMVSGNLYFATAGTERMRIDYTGGNVGIGTSSPSAKLHVYASSGDINGQIETAGAGQAALNLYNSTRQFRLIADASANAFVIYDQTASAERARINSSGNLLVGTTSAVTAGTKLTVSGSNADWMAGVVNTNASPRGLFLNHSTDSNGTANWFLYCEAGGSTQRMSVRSNGGIANFSANNANLSDRREKTNFAPAKSYLDVICAIPVQTFNYIDQNMEEDGGLTLGVVAQDVEAVAPELVSESNWGTEEAPKMRLSIYQTDLQYALMKCIQEQQALITQLQADVALLKGTTP
jgi:hypothetical protein